MSERVYFAVMAWPPSFDEARRVDALERALGVDRFRARELAKRRVPAIFTRLPPEKAEPVERQFAEWGCAVRGIMASELRPRLEPPLVQTIEITDDGCVITPWRGEPRTVAAREIMLLVRGHVRSGKTKRDGDFGVQALHQLQGTLGARDWDQGPARRGSLEVHEVLDIHLRDTEHLRVLDSRFGFECLPAKAGSARENMDQLAGLLSSLSHAPVDRDFEHAHYLAEFTADFAAQSDWRGPQGFSLYSAWLGSIRAREI